MRLHVIAVGRMRKGPERALIDGYARRLGWPYTEREIVDPKAGPGGADREADLLLAAAPRGAVVVALDGRGKTTSSEALAARLGGWRDQGVRDLAFLIGGADGHGDRVRREVGEILSLGAMTWPHLLARIMLVEQLYRATRILAHHPYHRGS